MRITVLIAVLFYGVCNAQTPELPIFNNVNYGDTENAYYKDTYNDLNNYVGTWLYTNGATSLKIVFQKKELTYNDFNNIYEDLLVGEYQYIENGVEKFNSLSQLTQDFEEAYKYNIVGNIINLASNIPTCDTCDPNQKRVIVIFQDPEREAMVQGLSGEAVIRRVDDGNTQKIEVWLRSIGHVTYTGNTPPAIDSFRVPWGTYTLTKIN